MGTGGWGGGRPAPRTKSSGCFGITAMTLLMLAAALAWLLF